MQPTKLSWLKLNSNSDSQKRWDNKKDKIGYCFNCKKENAGNVQEGVDTLEENSAAYAARGANNMVQWHRAIVK